MREARASLLPTLLLSLLLGAPAAVAQPSACETGTDIEGVAIVQSPVIKPCGILLPPKAPGDLGDAEVGVGVVHRSGGSVLEFVGRHIPQSIEGVDSGATEGAVLITDFGRIPEHRRVGGFHIEITTAFYKRIRHHGIQMCTDHTRTIPRARPLGKPASLLGGVRPALDHLAEALWIQDRKQ